MKNKYYCIILLLLSILSCRKDNNGTPSFTSDSYPLAVGNWWEYKLTDSYYGSVDTITLSVVSIVKSGPYMKYACNFIYNGNVTDSGYFLQSDTSMSFVVSNSYPVSSLNFYLKFPIQTGQYWQGVFSGDSTLVVGVNNSYSAYGHTYGPCYFTNESYNLPHNFKVESMTLTPKVGLINQSIDFNSDTAGKTATYPGGIQIQQSILLLDYHVQ